MHNRLVPIVRVSAFAAITSTSAALAGDHFGGFTAPDTLTAGSFSYSLTTGDFNNDGVVDLATGGLGNNQVNVFIGLGAGQFQPFDSFPAGGFPIGLASGDLNGDGADDLVIAHLGSFSVYLSDGDGTFSFFDDYSGAGNSDISLVDVTGDGTLDVVTSDSNGFHVVPGVGGGLFSFPQEYDAEAGSFLLTINDFNNDGALDVATANNGGNSVSVFLNNCAGAYFPHVTLAATTPSDIVGGDFDGDGDVDLAVYQNGGAGVKIFLGDGEGNFAAHDEHPVTQSSEWLAVGDIDGDGDLDIVTSNFDDQSISVLIGLGDGSFEPEMRLAAGLVEPVRGALVDLNGDASPDIALPDLGSAVVALLFNQTSELPPGAFSLVSPPDGANGLPLPEALNNWPGATHRAPLFWTRAAGFVVDYTITIARDQAMTDVAHSQSGLGDTTFDMPDGVLAPGMTYYWSVVAENPAGATVSTAGAFEFATAPRSADLNGDGVVNGADLANLLANWGIVD